MAATNPREIVDQYYAAWTKDRQAGLEAKQELAWVNQQRRLGTLAAGSTLVN